MKNDPIVRKPSQEEFEYLLRYYLEKKSPSPPTQAETVKARAYIRANTDAVVVENYSGFSGTVMCVVWEGNFYGSLEIIELPVTPMRKAKKNIPLDSEYSLVPEADQPLPLITLKNGSFICLCGNEDIDQGFYPCNEQGEEVEPTGEEWSKPLYVCEQCRRIIDQDTLQVVGNSVESTVLRQAS